MSRVPSSKLRVAAGVCVRNSAKTLVKATESTRGQDYQLLEVISVDDGSEDENISIVDERRASNLVRMNKSYPRL